jgi:hypothetical protein
VLSRSAWCQGVCEIDVAEGQHAKRSHQQQQDDAQRQRGPAQPSPAARGRHTRGGPATAGVCNGMGQASVTMAAYFPCPFAAGAPGRVLGPLLQWVIGTGDGQCGWQRRPLQLRAVAQW